MMHGRKKSDFASVIDRVVQQALVQKMTPIFEPLSADCSLETETVPRLHHRRAFSSRAGRTTSLIYRVSRQAQPCGCGFGLYL